MRSNYIDRVWKAVKSGARTTREIEAITEIPVKKCNRSIWHLKRRGLVRVTSTLKSHNGVPLNVYEIVR